MIRAKKIRRMTAALAAALIGAVVVLAPSTGSAYHENQSLSFEGPDGTLVSSGAFWARRQDHPEWFAEGGTMHRRSGIGWTNSANFRMWTRRNDLAFTTTEMDIRFNGWTGGSRDWHGINLWLNRKLRSNSDGSRINDGPRQEGYVVDFLNRDGSLRIMKKVGDTYHTLSKKAWAPQQGQWYRWGGRVIDNGSTSTIQILLEGQVVLQATDNGVQLHGGRVGLRGDRSNFNVDNLTVRNGP
jgi:roadblock/LC7 domain-containing protein